MNKLMNRFFVVFVICLVGVVIFLRQQEYFVKTHRGNVSLDELNENVYKKYGYEIVANTVPVPTTKMINEPTCETVYSDWLKISDEAQPAFPPKEIPDNLMNEFLMNGYAGLFYKYYNDRNAGKSEKPYGWDKISEYMQRPKEKLGGDTYKTDGVSIYHAMQANRLDGMSGLVVGSMRPWVEAIALTHGAKKLLTVEYNPLNIQEEFRDRMSSILPADFMIQWEKYAGTFDFAASFSSIEHSGLGRYGDPIDPIGDLREMLKIKCMLKKGGLLFLGLPLGTDGITYNAHRIYGPIRLGMIFYGFEWLGTFTGVTPEPFDLTADILHSKQQFHYTQHTMVLRKI